MRSRAAEIPSSAGRTVEKLSWMIESGPQRVADADDQSRWLYELGSADGVRRKLMVIVTGSAMAMGAEHLPAEVDRLRDDQGRAALGRCLEWAEPPRRIEASSGWINLRFDSGALVRLR